MGQARPKKLVCRAWEVKDKTDTTRSIHLKLESGININHLLKCIYSTLLSQAFAREHYYKLFRKSFPASISAFAKPSDINVLTTQYMIAFRHCSG